MLAAWPTRWARPGGCGGCRPTGLWPPGTPQPLRWHRRLQCPRGLPQECPGSRRLARPPRVLRRDRPPLGASGAARRREQRCPPPPLRARGPVQGAPGGVFARRPGGESEVAGVTAARRALDPEVEVRLLGDLHSGMFRPCPKNGPQAAKATAGQPGNGNPCCSANAVRRGRLGQCWATLRQRAVPRQRHSRGTLSVPESWPAG